MAVAMDASERGAPPPICPNLDLVEEFLGQSLILGCQIVGHPVSIQHEVACLAAEIFHAEPQAIVEAAGAAHGVDAAEKAPDPLAIVGCAQFRPTAAAAREYGIA